MSSTAVEVKPGVRTSGMKRTPSIPPPRLSSSKRTRDGIGKPAPFREEAPSRLRANPRQAIGADAPAAWRAFEGLRETGFLKRNAALGIAHPGLYDVAFTLER